MTGGPGAIFLPFKMVHSGSIVIFPWFCTIYETFDRSHRDAIASKQVGHDRMVYNRFEHD